MGRQLRRADTRKILIVAVTAALALGLPTRGWAGAPTEELRQYTDQVLRVMQDSTLTPQARRAAVRDLAMAEAQYPGWVAQLLTHPVQGLENYRELIDTLTMGKDVIKAFCDIAPLDSPVGIATNGLAYAR